MKITLLLFCLLLSATLPVFAQWTNSTPLNTTPLLTGGNVGIGTSTPAWKLDVTGLIALNGQAFINVDGSSMNIGDVSGGDGYRDKLHFSTRDQKRVTIDETGNVGIGTLTPVEKLHVAGNIQIGKTEQYTEGSYSISMPPGSATVNGGNGKNLTISAGSSDNISYARGGLLILRPGIPSAPSINYGNVLIADNGGNVGIGTASPIEKLHVKDGAFMVSTASNNNISLRIDARSGEPTLKFSRWLGDANNQLFHNAFIGQYYNQQLGSYCLGIGTGASSSANQDANNMVITIPTNGNVGIGTMNPDAKLAVKGNIHAQGLDLDMEGAMFPDYVFEKNYNLLPLSEVENYVNEHKHLPEVPSAAEIQKTGMDVKEMNLLLLKKVEELTLYMIDLKRDNEKQDAIIRKLLEEKK